MGRDISVVCSHSDCENASIRAIIDAQNSVDTSKNAVSFSLKPNKVFIFDRETEKRINSRLG